MVNCKMNNRGLTFTPKDLLPHLKKKDMQMVYLFHDQQAPEDMPGYMTVLP